MSRTIALLTALAVAGCWSTRTRGEPFIKDIRVEGNALHVERCRMDHMLQHNELALVILIPLLLVAALAGGGGGSGGGLGPIHVPYIDSSECTHSTHALPAVVGAS